MRPFAERADLQRPSSAKSPASGGVIPSTLKRRPGGISLSPPQPPSKCLCSWYENKCRDCLSLTIALCGSCEFFKSGYGILFIFVISYYFRELTLAHTY